MARVDPLVFFGRLGYAWLSTLSATLLGSLAVRDNDSILFLLNNFVNHFF